MSSSVKNRFAVTSWATAVFTVAFGSIGVRNLIDWPGFLIVAALLIGIGIYLSVKFHKKNIKLRRLSKPLVLFIAFAFLSTIWSLYPFETFLGSISQLATTATAACIALTLTWDEIIRTLAISFRIVLGISILFEIWVAFIVRHPIVQNFTPVDNPDNPSVLLLWSRNHLLQGGPIQGIIANSALLGMLALMALIVFAVQLTGKQVRSVTGWFWILISTLTIILTKVATVLVAIPVVLLALVLALWARRLGDKRRPVYITGCLFIVGTIIIAITKPPFIFTALGRDASLTNRTMIWDHVIQLASQHQWLGTGWISYWAPWVEPLRSIAVVLNLPVPHAHNAWLDVWLQVGFVGLLFFATLVLVTLQRVWCRAVDRPMRGAGIALPYAVGSITPWLLMVALLVQTFSESRILVESGWLMLTIFAIKTKTDYDLPSRHDEQIFQSWRSIPISNSNKKTHKNH